MNEVFNKKDVMELLSVFYIIERGKWYEDKYFFKLMFCFELYNLFIIKNVFGLVYVLFLILNWVWVSER